MAKLKFDDVMNDLDEVVKEMDAFVADKVKTNETNLEQTLATFVKIRDMYNRINEVKKHIGKVRDHMAYTVVPERMQDEGIKSLTMDELGVRVTMTSQIRASIKAGHKDDAFEWLRKHELGGLITETVNASTLSAQCKDMMAQGEELPEDYFNVHTALNTSVTKAK